MRHFRHLAIIITLILGAYGVGIGATNKNLPGARTISGNDKPVVQSLSDSLVGASDTGFVACGIGATYCQTNVFNSIRYPLQYTGMTNSSSVVVTNPDSIVCNFMVVRKDADTSDGSAGIYLNMGTASSPVWSLYGGSVTAVPTSATLTKYSVVAPFAVGRQFRPWVTVTTTTDTVRVRFVECRSK